MFDEIVWKDGEKLAGEYMKENGYEIIYTNFRCVGVEVDIVAILSAKVQARKFKAKLKEKIKTLNAQKREIKAKKYKKNGKDDPKQVIFVLGQKNALDKIKAQKKTLKISFKSQIKNVADLLVITEVKARSTDKFGTGAESIDEYKIKNIKKAGNFLLNDDKFKNHQIRFDVASVDGDIVNYIEDAF